MKALQISNARIGELIEENYYLREQLEKQGENNMGISEATKQELEDTLNKALEKETPESFNEFLDEQKPADTENGAKGNYREIPNSAWSEEDESMFDLTLFYLDRYVKMKDVSKCEIWLKSLKERYTWKPSDEQIVALRWVLNHIHYDSHKEEISGLLDQIKGL